MIPILGSCPEDMGRNFYVFVHVFTLKSKVSALSYIHACSNFIWDVDTGETSYKTLSPSKYPIEKLNILHWLLVYYLDVAKR